MFQRSCKRPQMLLRELFPANLLYGETFKKKNGTGERSTAQSELSENNNSGLKCPLHAPSAQAGNEVDVGQKNGKRDGHSSPVHSLCTPSSLAPPTLYLTHSGGILLGPVSSWPVSCGLIQLGDFHSPPISREKTL